MASHQKYAESALSAAGIVGQWEIDGESGTASMDADGSRFLYGDDRFADIPMSISQVFASVHEDDLGALTADCSARMRSGGPALIEFTVIVPGHGPRPVQVRGHFARNDKGRMIGRGVFIDLARHRVEEPQRQFNQNPDTSVPNSIEPADPLSEAAERSVELRKALGRSGHSALRLAADLLMWEINTALAARLTISHKDVPALKNSR